MELISYFHKKVKHIQPTACSLAFRRRKLATKAQLFPLVDNEGRRGVLSNIGNVVQSLYFKETSMKNKLQIVEIEIEKLMPYSGNAKLHPAFQIDQIAASIKRFGFNDPIALNDDNTIIEGHGRLYAAQKLGLKTVPCLYLKHMSEAERKAYMLAHNKLTMNTGFDQELLAAEIECIAELAEDIDLAAVGVIGEIVVNTGSGEEYRDRDEGDKQIVCPNCGSVIK